MKNIKTNLTNFKTDLSILSPEHIFRKYFVDDKCYILDENQQRELKSAICDKFHVQYNNIIIVGSGKLGFSIKPERRFLEFGEDSDIDIAIISTELFVEYWYRVNKYVSDNATYGNYSYFCKELSRHGWVRPDLFPRIDIQNNWFDFFSELTSSKKYSNYKLSAGIYYNYHFLETYQLNCIKECKEEIKNGNKSN